MLLGSVPDLGRNESRIPVLLVQIPGFRGGGFQHCIQQQPDGGPGSDFGSGWDVILPAGWSMAFWIALVYRGAKAVGLREQRSLAFEAGRLTFPDCCPDTPSGAEISSSRAAELRLAYSRRPPAKRCNYDKMGVLAPFHCPWPELVQAWMNSCEVVIDDDGDKQLLYCIRNHKLLQRLESVCSGAATRLKSSKQHSLHQCSTASVLHELQQSGSAIVKVSVVMLGRGAPSQFTLICLPTTDDIPTSSSKNKRSRGNVEGPTEPLRRKSSNAKTGDSNPVTVLGSPVRPTIGFVVEGGFSHATGKGCGVGFVSAVGLWKLLEQKSDPASCSTVLVRCTHSLQYRLAVLRVVS